MLQESFVNCTGGLGKQDLGSRLRGFRFSDPNATHLPNKTIEES